MARRDWWYPIDFPPAGTWGLVAKDGDDWYGVVANWAEASAPVYVLTANLNWRQCGRQVADFRHSPEDALEDVLLASARFWAQTELEAQQWAERVLARAEELPIIELGWAASFLDAEGHPQELGGWESWEAAKYARRISGLPRGLAPAIARAIARGAVEAYVAPAPPMSDGRGNTFNWRRVVAVRGRLYCRLPLPGQSRPPFEDAAYLFAEGGAHGAKAMLEAA